MTEQALRFASLLGIHSLFIGLGALIMAVAVHALPLLYRDEAGNRRGPIELVVNGIGYLILVGVALGMLVTPVVDMSNRHGVGGVSVLLAQSAAAFVIARRLPLRTEVAQPRVVNVAGPAARFRRLRWLLAGLPSSYMAIACGAVLVGSPLPGLDRGALGLVYSSEFAAFAFTFSFGVWVLAAVIAPPGRVRFIVGYLLACGFVFFLGLVGAPEKGKFLLPFLSAMVATYGGLLTRAGLPDAHKQVLSRVAVSAAALVILMVAFGLGAGLPELIGEWPGTTGGLLFGVVYFLFLAGCEFAGLYDRIWSRR